MQKQGRRRVFITAGFTIIELLAGLAVLTSILFAADRLMMATTSFIRDVTGKSTKVMQLNAVLRTVEYNIKSSAWVDVISRDEIELHSHYADKIRKYKLSDGVLWYGEAKPSGTVLDSNAAKTAILKDLCADKMFEGLGDKLGASRYAKVRVAFWDKDYPNDVASVVCCPGEGRNMVYVSDKGQSGYEDGTKAYPYSRLESGLTAVAGAANASVYDIVAVMSGAYTVTRDINVQSMTNLAVMENASINIGPGVTVTMGKNARITLSNDFTWMGSPARPVVIKTGDVSTTWDCVAVIDGRDRDAYYTMGYLDVSGGKYAFIFHGLCKARINATITDSKIHECRPATVAGRNVYAFNMTNCSLYNTGYMSLCTYAIAYADGSTGGFPVTAGYLFRNNTLAQDHLLFIDNGWNQYNTEITGKILFDRNKSAQGGVNFRLNAAGGGPDLMSTCVEVTNNIFMSTGFNYSESAPKAGPSSLVANNTFEWGQVDISAPADIVNNGFVRTSSALATNTAGVRNNAFAQGWVRIGSDTVFSHNYLYDTDITMQAGTSYANNTLEYGAIGGQGVLSVDNSVFVNSRYKWQEPNAEPVVGQNLFDIASSCSFPENDNEDGMNWPEGVGAPLENVGCSL